MDAKDPTTISKSIKKKLSPFLFNGIFFYNVYMENIKDKAKRYATVAIHGSVLILSIIKTYVNRFIQIFKRQKAQYLHLQEFIDNKRETRCNLTTLFDLLEKDAGNRLQIAPMDEAQKIYKSKDDLVSYLPDIEKGVEILAIPVAVKAFKYFRHFVTIIVDKRDNIVEFYDPIGFDLTQYKNDVLWGPKAKRKNLLKLRELVEYIQEKYGINQLIENKDMHQTDFNQCALFVYDRIYKRGVKGFSFEEANKTPMTSKQAFI